MENRERGKRENHWTDAGRFNQ